jgi:hypothetical protein
MNRRLPRIALIAVLLLSTLVVLQMSGGTAAPNSMAQGVSCDDALATQTAALSTPVAASSAAPGPDVVPWVSYRSQTVTTDEVEGVPETLTLVISIQQSVEFSPGEMTGDSIIQIDSGTVTVEACGEIDLAVRHEGSNDVIVLEPGSDAELEPGSTIFVPAGGLYRITTADTQASFTLIGTGTFVLRGLCGGTGC